MARPVGLTLSKERIPLGARAHQIFLMPSAHWGQIILEPTYNIRQLSLPRFLRVRIVLIFTIPHRVAWLKRFYWNFVP
jgi:hypothetical protein